MGSATVPVAPVGVPPTRPRRSHPSPNGAFILRGGVFGGTPKRAGETPRAPNRTASFRLNRDRFDRLAKLFRSWVGIAGLVILAWDLVLTNSTLPRILIIAQLEGWRRQDDSKAAARSPRRRARKPAFRRRKRPAAK